MMHLRIYIIFPSDIFPAFTQAIANMPYPFNNNIACMDGGILWALIDLLSVVNHIYVTADDRVHKLTLLDQELQS